VERVKGPADLLESGDCTLSFMGEEYELEAEDGWFYPQGGSPRYWVVTDGCIDPGTTVKTYLISCTPNGTIEKIEQPDLFQFANLFYSGTLQFGSKIMQLNINLKGYEAWRAAARENEEVPRTEEEQPGFLITAEVDLVGGADPLEAKIVAAKLADTGTGGLTRWLRFSDPTKVALKYGDTTFNVMESVRFNAAKSELQVEGLPTDDTEYQIFMSNPTTWAAGTSVTVEYLIRDKEGNKFPGADKVQLLRPVVIAIGDSLTFGYMANSQSPPVPLTANWREYWDNYPNAEAWATVGADRTSLANQGWRGYLNRDLAPAGFIWEGEETSGHGPKHCGYSGAQTGHINARLTPEPDPRKQYRNMPTEALKKEPCYAIVIYLIGVNDANNGKDGIYDRWLQGYKKIQSLREGRGKTLFLACTVPPQDQRYVDRNRKASIKFVENLNASIEGQQSARKPATMREIIVPLADRKHSDDDDGLHFTSTGYELISDELLRRIKEGIGK
ncbi:MAG: SGNH/GDSL hydrolase family protein, partial [Phycisphaerales bacterium]|nr:SGNH/GDSL hydrolase family protein [Phycisphaerales bacterium]